VVKGELQLGWDGPCGDDEQARGLTRMHHVVVMDKWRLGAEGPEEFGRSHGRYGDEDDVGQVKEEDDGKLEYAARAVGA